jgi:hypothetical protein
MPIGGFNGSDPAPTLAQFQQDVAAGRIHYFLSGGRGGFNGPGFGSNGRFTGGSGTPGSGTATRGAFGNQMGGSRASQEITTWVEENFAAQTVDGVTVYDLTQPSTSAATPVQGA